MPSGFKLSEFEKGQITTHRANGAKLRDIARLVGRSLKVVWSYLQNPEEYGTAKHTGRPSKLSGRDKRRIYRAASNSTATCIKIKRDLDLTVSPETIRRTISKNPNLVRRKMKKAPALKEVHKRRRLEWVRQNMNHDWSKMIWSDEKKFNLDGPDGYRYYWHDLRKEKRYFSRRVHGGGGVMVWGAFCQGGRLDLSFPDLRLNSQRYQEILQARLLPPWQVLRQRGYEFMHDNAPSHASFQGPRSTRAWLERHQVRVLPWPACSPDQNLIENIWGILGAKFTPTTRHTRPKKHSWKRSKKPGKTSTKK
uniref:Transposase n=1 Tax=Acrobeloides nanus TaxID=290746 RepID=A0A914E2I8_9BILA